MKQFYTYLHCKPNGDPFYVGKGVGRRCRSIHFGRNQYHRNIVAKYGAKNILIFVFPCDSEEQALADEIQQIAQLRSDGYDLCNFTDGGEGCSGRVLSTETKVKISAAHKGKPKSEAHRYSMKYRVISEEHRRNISISLSGKTHSPETREKMKASQQKRREEFIASDEFKMKVSIAKKGHRLSESTRKKISEIQRGKRLSEEHKKNISEGMKGRPISVETREKIGLAHKNKVVSEETRKKQSLARRRFLNKKLGIAEEIQYE